MSIPKLGELRQLPRVETSDDGNERSAVSPRSRSVGGTIAFVSLSLIAVAALLGAGYNAVRWMTIETDMTTESHLENIDREFAAASPAAMVKEFEDMEVHSLDLTAPYKYQVTVNEKNRWRFNTLLSFGIVLLCGAGAFVAASAGAKREG